MKLNHTSAGISVAGNGSEFYIHDVCGMNIPTTKILQSISHKADDKYTIYVISTDTDTKLHILSQSALGWICNTKLLKKGISVNTKLIINSTYVGIILDEVFYWYDGCILSLTSKHEVLNFTITDRGFVLTTELGLLSIIKKHNAWKVINMTVPKNAGITPDILIT
jgi:hypothetical protein